MISCQVRCACNIDVVYPYKLYSLCIPGVVVCVQLYESLIIGKFVLHIAGDLQDILEVMCDRANEAGLALSAFARISKGHAALTSECGSILEEVYEQSIKLVFSLSLY